MSVNSSVSPAQRRTSRLKIRSVTPARGACSTSGPIVGAALATILPALPLLPGPLRAEPRQVILVRHADKDVDRADPNLSPAGLRRALRLGRLLPACFGPVERLGSYGFNAGSQKNARSYQTAVPLAVATGLPIRLFGGGEDDSPAAPPDLRQDPWMAGRSVVLVWEHRRLPALAAALGWPAMAPIAADDFDDLVLLRYSGVAGAPPLVTRHRQSELLRQPCYQRAVSPLPQVPLP